MKISNSKKQLAKIIHEHGGWCQNTPAICAVQARKHGTIMFAAEKPERRGDSWFAGGIGFVGALYIDVLLPNWHQTILSRDEYRHLYPVAEPTPEPAPEPVVESKPTIEQLAADYRNRKDYADRKQQEADAAKADAEAKLAELVAAGKALGLVLSVAGVKPELIITDWQDLRVGDRIWVGGSNSVSNCPEGEYDIEEIDDTDEDQPFGVIWMGGVQWPQIHNRGWRFIRRPAKGDANA